MKVDYTDPDQASRQRLKDQETLRQDATRRKREIEKRYEGRKNKRVEDDPEWKKAHADQVAASEAMGEIAVDAMVQKHMPGAKKITFDFGNNAKQGMFDAIYEYQGKYYIFEAKGGGSGLGARTTSIGEYVQQGTRNYLDDIATELKQKSLKSPDPSTRKNVRNLLNAITDNNFEYCLVRQKVDNTGQLVQEITINKFR